MRTRGFTLLELMVALAIAGVLLAIATPTFQRQRAMVSLRSASTQTLSSLHLARRLALARGQSITVCPSDDGLRCAFGSPQWLMFANGESGTANRLESGDQLLRRWRLPADLEVTGTRGHATFLPRAGAATTVTFRFRHRLGGGVWRDVIVSQTGRPRIALP